MFVDVIMDVIEIGGLGLTMFQELNCSRESCGCIIDGPIPFLFRFEVVGNRREGGFGECVITLVRVGVMVVEDFLRNFLCDILNLRHSATDVGAMLVFDAVDVVELKDNGDVVRIVVVFGIGALFAVDDTVWDVGGIACWVGKSQVGGGVVDVDSVDS